MPTTGTFYLSKLLDPGYIPVFRRAASGKVCEKGGSRDKSYKYDGPHTDPRNQARGYPADLEQQQQRKNGTPLPFRLVPNQGGGFYPPGGSIVIRLFSRTIESRRPAPPRFQLDPPTRPGGCAMHRVVFRTRRSGLLSLPLLAATAAASLLLLPLRFASLPFLLPHWNSSDRGSDSTAGAGYGAFFFAPGPPLPTSLCITQPVPFGTEL